MRLASFLLLGIVLAADSVAFAEPIDSREDYLVRGEPVPQGELFGTVALLRAGADETLVDLDGLSLPYRVFCSGTLITPTTVLSAGHCVQACPDGDCRCGEDGCQVVATRRIYVAAGMTDLESVWEAELVGVSNIVLQDDYLDWGSLEFACDQSFCPGLAWDSNDLALLHLATPITSLRPVALYPEDRIFDLAGAETVGLAQGYGLPLPPESEELLPQDSYVALLNQGPSKIVRTTHNELLTTRSEDDVAVCYGDSGGPLYVVEGGSPMVAGVASRLRGDARECDGGGVYALAPAYTEWIEENVTGELPSPSSGAGGCSASRTNGPGNGVAFLVLMPLLLLLRLRGVTACVALTLLGTVACGSNDDASFCTEQYDPGALFCDPGVEMLDLRAAEALARADVPDDALLVKIRSSAVGLLDPDGRAESWSFTYYLPGGGDSPGPMLLQTLATPTHTYPDDPILGQGQVICIPSEPIPVVDSRRLLHDAIRFLESQGLTLTLLDGGNLFVSMSHVCLADARPQNYVRYRGMGAVFDDEANFRALVEVYP